MVPWLQVRIKTKDSHAAKIFLGLFVTQIETFNKVDYRSIMRADDLISPLSSKIG